MIIIIDIGKSIWQGPTPIHMKTISKLEIEKNFLKLIKSIYKKLTASITLSGEKLDAFPLR